MELFKTLERIIDPGHAAALVIDVQKTFCTPGGEFISHPHTFENFRKEMWLPDLISGSSYEAWHSSGSPNILNRAAEKVKDILDSHHPRGVYEATEEKLVAIVNSAAPAVGLPDYRIPALPA